MSPNSDFHQLCLYISAVGFAGECRNGFDVIQTHIYHLFHRLRSNGRLEQSLWFYTQNTVVSLDLILAIEKATLPSPAP